MSNPSGPDQPDEDVAEGENESADPAQPADDQGDTAAAPVVNEPETEIMVAAEPTGQSDATEPAERRFTAPSGFDGSTQRIDTPPEPPTEVFATSSDADAKIAAPQVIPPRGEAPKPPSTRRRSWGWVIALILVIAAIVALAVLGTVLLTRKSTPAVSQEDRVRTTIQEFDAAVQSGDLAKLRTITCGATRDNYVKYDDRTWTQTHDRIAAAKQYPVVASIDQVLVKEDHAEANVTTFMAYAPATRSTRSFDLQFRDDQWKICQAPST